MLTDTKTILAVCYIVLCGIALYAFFAPTKLLKDGLFLFVSLGFLAVWCLREPEGFRSYNIAFWMLLSGLNTYILARTLRQAGR